MFARVDVDGGDGCDYYDYYYYDDDDGEQQLAWQGLHLLAAKEQAAHVVVVAFAPGADDVAEIEQVAAAELMEYVASCARIDDLNEKRPYRIIDSGTVYRPYVSYNVWSIHLSAQISNHNLAMNIGMASRQYASSNAPSSG